MRRTIIVPAVLAAAALAVPAASAPAASHGTKRCAHVQPKPGSLEYQRAWSDAWHLAHPGELLPGPQVPGSIGEQRAWQQAWQTANPGKLLVVATRRVTVRSQQQC